MENKKAESKLTRKINSSNILDGTVAIQPVPARKSIPSFSSMAGRVSKQVKGKIKKFPDCLISFVLETIRTTVNEKADKLKNDI